MRKPVIALFLLALASPARGEVRFATSESGVQESTAQKAVSVQLSAASAQTVRVPFTVSGSAGSGDFSVTTASPVVFSPGQTSRSIIVAPVNDSGDELGETVVLTLGTPENDTLGAPAVHTLNIVDDDDPPPGSPTVAFELATSSVSEGATTRVVKVTLSAASSLTVRVPFSVGAGSATTGSDFVVATASPLSFPPGQTVRNIVIEPVADTEDELDETILLAIATPANAVSAPPRKHTLTLTDDDAPPADAPSVSFRLAAITAAEDGGARSVNLRLSAPSALRVLVPFTVTRNTAAAGDFTVSSTSPVTFAPGQTNRNITINPVDDAQAEFDETLVLKLGVPANARRGSLAQTILTIADDDRAPLAFNTASPLGTNLAPVTDFTNEYPFANHFKQARFWTSGNAATFTFDDGRSFNLDSNGYVTSLKADQVARAILFTGLPRETSLNAKRFVLRFDGDGEFSYSGAALVSFTPGRDVIQLGTGGADDEATLIMNLVRTNPANRVRNVRLTPEGGICRGNPFATAANAAACASGDFVSFEDAASAGEILFNPAFLDGLKTYRSIRFMDWLRTNNSAVVSPAQRAQLADAFWSSDAGVPLEAAIALANVLDADPWINLPHTASDAYAALAALIVRDQLEPARRAYVEYSNETWNGIFVQAEFVQDRGGALGLDQPEGNRFIGGLRFYSQRSQQIFDIFGTAFGASRAARIERVMATQAVNPFLTQTILEFGDAATKCDSFAIAPYFGDTIVDADRAAALTAAGIDGVFSWLTTGSPDLGFGSLPELDAAVQAQKDTVAGFGISLITYEGGQHFLAAGSVQFDAALNQLMDDVNRDARMKSAYLSYLGNWRARSGEVFWHYLHTDRWSVFGRWGSRESETQPRAQAPKFDALQTYIETQPLP